MSSKFKAAILGMGGVGGYFGGKLAQHFTDSNSVEVSFIARGENEIALRSNGLRLITPEDENTIFPAAVTSDPGELGTVDLVICCVKGYSLEDAIGLIEPCLNKQTSILPLLNGVDAAGRIKRMLPAADVWNGCVYIISHRESPGVVKVKGDIRELYFGSSAGGRKKLEYVHGLFVSSGINACLEDDILKTVWGKFVFISPMATLTSYLDLCIGEILENPERRNMLVTLIKEVTAVAYAKNIIFGENAVREIMEKTEALPYETTSSMHKDFKKGSKTEVNSLTTYVVNAGREIGIETPLYDKLNKELRSRK